MRSVYLVTYDISDPKRLRRVFKVMHGFGQHIQLSVFRCTLGDRQRVQLEAALLGEMNLEEDQALIVDLGPEAGRGAKAIHSVGQHYEPPGRGPLVL